MIDDPTLLRRYVADRSEAAFAELVRRHLSLVYFAALRQLDGDAHTAQDVTQAVFTLLARRATSLASHPVLAGWLFQATRYTARDARRAARRRRAREEEAHAMQQPDTSAPPTADWERLRPVLDEALSALNARDREAVLLRFLQERPFAEVAAAQRVTEDAARMRVARALEKLRGELARRGVTSTAAALATLLAQQAGAAVPAGLAASVTDAALAAAAAATGLLTFMTTSKTVLGVTAVLALAGIGAAVSEHRQVRQDAAALASLTRERDSLRSRATRLETQSREADRAAAAARAEPAPARPTAPTRARTVSGPDGLAWNAFPPQYFRQPEFVKLYLQQHQARMKLEFAPLYRRLRLTPDQIARFENAMLGGQVAVCQVLGAADAVGTSGAEPAVMDVAYEKQQTAFSQVHEALGDAGFQQFQQYLLSLVGFDGPSPREMVESTAGALSLAGTPLTADQSDQLLQLITDHRRIGRRGNPALPQGAIDWAAVDAQAQGLLSAPQLQQLQSVRERSELDRRLEAYQAAAESGTPPPGSATPSVPASGQ